GSASSSSIARSRRLRPCRTNQHIRVAEISSMRVQSLSVSTETMDRGRVAFCKAWNSLQNSLRSTNLRDMQDVVEREHMRELDRLTARLRNPGALDWLRQLHELGQAEGGGAVSAYQTLGRETAATGATYLDDVSNTVRHYKYVRKAVDAAMQRTLPSAWPIDAS
ncbi:hypothetical protein, partial [Actinoplanes sp. NPDC049802]|uniref:hypothetical protein n=1 Tax=Actinoplanes sp. NPDC049802 TaxID=3154742 RepID=UPI0033CF4552